MFCPTKSLDLEKNWDDKLVVIHNINENPSLRNGKTKQRVETGDALSEVQGSFQLFIIIIMVRGEYPQLTYMMELQ